MRRLITRQRAVRCRTTARLVANYTACCRGGLPPPLDSRICRSAAWARLAWLGLGRRWQSWTAAGALINAGRIRRSLAVWLLIVGMVPGSEDHTAELE